MSFFDYEVNSQIYFSCHLMSTMVAVVTTEFLIISGVQESLEAVTKCSVMSALYWQMKHQWVV